MNIKSISTTLNPLQKTGETAAGKNTGFADLLKNAIQTVNERMNEADTLTQKSAVGEPVDIHELMIASTKAELSFRTLLQVRNKALTAYEEIMRMQL
jgi:flagellar hook-basal body complex protein FliE